MRKYACHLMPTPIVITAHIWSDYCQHLFSQSCCIIVSFDMISVNFCIQFGLHMEHELLDLLLIAFLLLYLLSFYISMKQDRVGSLQGGIRFLELCGFEKIEGDEFLFLARDKVDMAVLNSAGSELTSAINNPFFGVL